MPPVCGSSTAPDATFIAAEGSRTTARARFSSTAGGNRGDDDGQGGIVQHPVVDALQRGDRQCFQPGAGHRMRQVRGESCSMAGVASPCNSTSRRPQCLAGRLNAKAPSAWAYVEAYQVSPRGTGLPHRNVPTAAHPHPAREPWGRARGLPGTLALSADAGLRSLILRELLFTSRSRRQSGASQNWDRSERDGGEDVSVQIKRAQLSWADQCRYRLLRARSGGLNGMHPRASASLRCVQRVRRPTAGRAMPRPFPGPGSLSAKHQCRATPAPWIARMARSTVSWLSPTGAT